MLMKSITLQLRASLLKFIITTAIVVAIMIIAWHFVSTFDFIDKFMFWTNGVVLALIPIVGSYLSMLDDLLYISDFIITEDSIRFIYRKGQKQVNVKVIEKQNIKAFNISVDTDYEYPRCFSFNVNTDIILKNGEKIIIEQKYFDSAQAFFNGARIKFVYFILKNKNEIPNFNFNINNFSTPLGKRLKSLFDTGKDLSIFEIVYDIFIFDTKGTIKLFIEFLIFWIVIILLILCFVH